MVKSKMAFHLIIGPMFASKSTELIQCIRRYRTIDKRVLVVNHVYNTRYDSAGLTTHDRSEVAADLNVPTLMPSVDIALTYDVIAIEEAQFFPDIVEFVQIITEAGKSVVAAGLSGDKDQRPFEVISRLIAMADSIQHLTAMCKLCGDGTVAPFTREITHTDGQVKVGAADSYEAVCRKHLGGTGDGTSPDGSFAP